MSTFTLAAQGPFSLAASIRFLEGFTPAAFGGTADQPLEAAFPVEGTWQTAGVRVREHPGGVACEVVAPAAPGRDLLAAVRAQVARILSLDVDGSGFPAVGERDPVIAGLQRRYPGLRPVAFWSPYEAAAWAVIGLQPQRHSPAQPAGRLQVHHGLADGERDRVGGEHHRSGRGARGPPQPQPLGVEARGRFQVADLQRDEIGSGNGHDLALLSVSGILI